MMRNWIIALSLVCTSAFAEVYKCSIDGKTVFSDQPCIKGEGGTINLKITPRSTPATPAENTAAAIERDRIQGNEKIRRDLDNRIAVRQIDEDIERNQVKLQLLNKQMDAELQALKNKKRSANNNLAGAVYEQSISSEMNAVASGYANKIELIKFELERLRRDRIQLTKN